MAENVLDWLFYAGRALIEGPYGCSTLYTISMLDNIYQRYLLYFCLETFFIFSFSLTGSLCLFITCVGAIVARSWSTSSEYATPPPPSP